MVVDSTRPLLAIPLIRPRPCPQVDDPEEDPEWFLRRPKHFDWWRSDWNPVNWDAEEWFKTHTEARAQSRRLGAAECTPQ